MMAALGWVLQQALLNRLLGRGLLPPVLVTFGLSIIIQNGLLELFSADSRRLNPGGLETASVALGPVTVGRFSLLTLAVAVLVLTALQLFIGRTAVGRAFRAPFRVHRPEDKKAGARPAAGARQFDPCCGQKRSPKPATTCDRLPSRFTV